MFAEGRVEHPSNADSPMDFTESGMVIEASAEQQRNADSPMETTPSDIMTVVKTCLLSCQGVHSLSDAPYLNQFPAPVKVTVSNWMQPKKIGDSADPTQSRFAGTDRFFSPLQSANEDFPREATESGMVTEDNPEQLQNAKSPMDVTDF